MQILREHATSKAARLQVALAEIPYVRARLGHADLVAIETLERQEKRLKAQLDEVRQHRALLRNKRRRSGQAVVAVVGYTNAGKTSLIKALSGEEKLQPIDRLFATLDVTVHRGRLPCGLQVLYVDTVGFMANIPTTLIDCFMATLEDVFLADVVIHVQDVSSEDAIYQRDHVVSTLERLAETDETKLPPVISVGNKIDKSPEPNVDCDVFISATNGRGLNDLRQKIENAVISATGRKVLTIRLSAGSEETRWLYKNSQVLKTEADPDNSQLELVRVLITEQALGHFYRHFIEDGPTI